MECSDTRLLLIPAQWAKVRVQGCHGCGVGHIPGLTTPYAMVWPKKGKKKKKSQDREVSQRAPLISDFQQWMIFCPSEDTWQCLAYC